MMRPLYLTANASRAMVTWDQVPNYGNGGSLSTVQLQMFPNGSFFVVYQSVNLGTGGITGDEALIGYTIGNNTAKPAEIDFSTALPAAMMFTEVPATPATSGMSHDCDLLQLGSTPTARASSLPTGTLAAVLHLGTNQTTLPLDAIGMPGCSAYTTAIAATAYMTLGTGQTASLPLGVIPSSPALKGVLIVTQAIAFKPGINALSLVASNGWDSIMGD